MIELTTLQFTMCIILSSILSAITSMITDRLIDNYRTAKEKEL